jgi:hypothetical protein
VRTARCHLRVPRTVLTLRIRHPLGLRFLHEKAEPQSRSASQISLLRDSYARAVSSMQKMAAKVGVLSRESGNAFACDATEFRCGRKQASCSMNDIVKRDSRTIFDRLASRGIEYPQIKWLVSVDLPHAAWFFDRHFSPRTAPQVLRQTERVRQMLNDDFLLSSEQKTEIEKTLSGAELFAWNSLLETSFPKLGPWHLSRKLLPTHQDPEPRYIQPDIQIVAIHEATREKRVAVVPGGRNSAAAWGDVWRKAFTQLGLLELVLKQRRRKHLVAARPSQGWRIFTKIVIPRLYDFLAPSYRKRGHVWSEKEKTIKRDAFFPNELLEDMRDILQQEYPEVFAIMTLEQLKAAIQRHLTSLRKSTEFAKYRRIAKRVLPPGFPPLVARMNSGQ